MAPQIHETPSLAARHLVEGLIGLVKLEAQSASGPWGRYVGARDALLEYIGRLETIALRRPMPTSFDDVLAFYQLEPMPLYQPDTASAPESVSCC